MKKLFAVCLAAILMLPSAALAGNTGTVGAIQTTACSEYHAAAITEDGVLKMWGRYLGSNTEPATSSIQVMEDVESVYIAEISTPLTAAIKNDGTLWMWGESNSFGELGEGSATEPRQIMDDVAAAAVGFRHSAAIKNDGTLWTWGLNNYGQLGDGTQTNSSVPIKVELPGRAVSVSLGQWHSAAVTEDGSLYTWGINQYGQLGNGTLETCLTPQKVMDGAASVQAREFMTAVVKKDGTLWTCGSKNNDQLGYHADKNVMEFTKVSGLDDVKQVTLGYRYGLAVKNNGELWGWGCGGALGEGLTGYSESYPQSIVSLQKITDGVDSAAAGKNLSLILKKDGTLLSCGLNGYGQIGNGEIKTNTWTLTPVPVSIDRVKTITQPRSGVEITGVSPESDSVTVGISVGEECAGMLIVAAYKNELLTDVQIKDFSASADTDNEISVPLDMAGADKISAFLWRDKSDLASLCKPFEQPLQ